MSKHIFFISFLFLTSMLYASIKFDSNKYIAVPDNNIFSFTNGSGQDRPYSFCAWVFYIDTRDNGYFPILSKFTDTSTFNGEYLFAIFETSSFGTAGVDQLFIENMATSSNDRIKAESTVSVPRNSWVHVAVTYDGSNNNTGFDFYINGELIGADKASDGVYVGMSNRVAPLQIGATLTITAFDDYANGYIDDVRIYNRKLTSDEIALIGKSRSRVNYNTDNLIGWWKMDSGNDETVGTIYDHSPYKNNANPFNGAKNAGSTWINYQ